MDPVTPETLRLARAIQSLPPEFVRTFRRLLTRFLILANAVGIVEVAVQKGADMSSLMSDSTAMEQSR